MKKVFAFVLMALFVSFSAMAYDDLVSNDGPFVAKQGDFMAGVSLVYLTAGDVIDADGEKQELGDDATNFRLPLKATYGVIENLEAFAILPIVSLGAGGETESGIADIWLGAKYAVMPEGLLTLRGTLNLATGDDDKGLGYTGGFGVDIGAIGQKWIMEEKLVARAQLGLRWQGEDSDTKVQPGIGFYVAGGLGYMVAEKTWVHGGLELLTNGDNKFDGNDVTDSGLTNLDLLIGAGKAFSEKFGLDGSLVFTLMGKNTNADMGLRIGAWYGF